MFRSARGQATVELVALLPVLAVLVLGAWQVAVAAHALWSASAAARAASRAAAVGGDPVAVARRVAGRTVAVRSAGDGRVRVALAVPAVVGHGTLATFRTSARFEAQR